MSDGGVLRRDLSEHESRICDSAVTYGGFVLKLVNTGHVDLCGAGEASYGIAAKSTREWVPAVATGGAWTATASRPVEIQRVGEALVQVLATNQVIAIGDPLTTTAGGTVDLGTWSVPPTIAELRAHVGLALEAKGLNAGGVVKALLWIMWM